MSVHSLRALAQTLNLSHATVSEALRGSLRVKASTRLRVAAEAERLGYQRNPLASALMTEMRRSRGATFRGLLGAVVADSTDAHRAELLAGARARAEELGFKLDLLPIRPAPEDSARLAALVSARGIRGLLLFPAPNASHLRDLDWSQLTALCVEHELESPRLNSLGPDHHQALALAFQELRARGYSRPGLVLSRDLAPTVARRWLGAFYAYLPEPYNAPRPLALGPKDDASAFTRWLAAGDFDVVLALDPSLAEWTGRASASRGGIGFCCLHLPTGDANVCSGLDHRPSILGRRAIELLAEQVLHSDHGQAALPLSSAFAVAWTEGRSLRPRLATQIVAV